jgi:hypothetical protein
MSDYLGVVSQEVVDIEACSADGWLLVEASMGTVPVVLVCPDGQPGSSVLRVLIDACVGPLVDRGLDEAFCFSVGAWG